MPPPASGGGGGCVTPPLTISNDTAPARCRKVISQSSALLCRSTLVTPSRSTVASRVPT